MSHTLSLPYVHDLSFQRGQDEHRVEPSHAETGVAKRALTLTSLTDRSIFLLLVHG